MYKVSPSALDLERAPISVSLEGSIVPSYDYVGLEGIENPFLNPLVSSGIWGQVARVDGERVRSR